MQHIEYEDMTISVQYLEVGMNVVALDRPWEETSFLLQGFVIASTEDVQELQRQCRNVTIQVKIEQVETLKTKPANPPKQTAANTKTQPTGVQTGPASARRVKYINQVSFEQAVQSSRITFDSARSLATSIMDGLRVGRSLDIDECRVVVEEVVASVLANKDALRFLSMIRHKDSYTAEHSMNVCILSATFARHLGLMEFEIHEIALCGLLHDVGKSRIPLEILNKPGRFTREEAYIMAEHPTHGRNILMSASSQFNHAIDVAHSHHERIDGKGYPRGLSRSQIPYYARIVALVDAYDAMTSHRCYGKAKPSEQALKNILRDKGAHFDPELAMEFVKCIGVYPSGSLVELSGGHLAIVIKANADDFARPTVLIVTDQQQFTVRQQHVLDLAEPTNLSLSIVREIANGTAGIDVKDFIEKGLKLH
jgi:HD-GYP domain-containing protein (c-di-GMP phosphodiesterase class II)